MLNFTMPGVPDGTYRVRVSNADQSLLFGDSEQFGVRGVDFIIDEPLQPGTWAYYVLMAILIVFFTYFYTAIIFNPIDISENLKKQGGFIPGVKPGARTAEYIERVMARITFPGSIFLTLIALLPIWISILINVPFQFGGTSLLIVVGVGLDTLQQLQQHLYLRKYDGFMKKGRVRFRGRAASF